MATIGLVTMMNVTEELTTQHLASTTNSTTETTAYSPEPVIGTTEETTTVEVFSNKTNQPPTSAGEEGDTCIALYVTIPLCVILVGLVAVLLFIIVRQKRKLSRGVLADAETGGRANISVTGSKSDFGLSENGFPHSNIDSEKEAKAQYYNTTGDNLSVAPENEHFNTRNLSVLDENEYSFGNFVKKMTETGVENYFFVADESGKKSSFQEEIYVNEQPGINKTNNSVSDNNQDMYNSLGVIPEDKNADCQNRKYNSMYDHTVVQSCHTQTDSRGKNDELRTTVYVSVNEDVRDVENLQERRMPKDKSGENSVSSNLPFYLELESEPVDAEPYSYCERVQIDQGNHEKVEPSKATVSVKCSSDIYSDSEGAQIDINGQMKQEDQVKKETQRGTKAPQKHYYNCKFEGKQLVDQSNPFIADMNRVSSEYYYNCEFQRHEVHCDEGDNDRNKDLDEYEIECTDDTISEPHEYFVLEKEGP